jgi:hypothetical protein
LRQATARRQAALLALPRDDLVLEDKNEKNLM